VTLMRAFGLWGKDPALDMVGKIVNHADTSKATTAYTMPEGAGLEAIARGFAAITTDDHQKLEWEFPMYDALYAFCQRKAAGEAVALRLDGYIDLPAHAGSGGFDHADIHEATRRLYVAHTANDAVDVIDCARQRCTGSIDGLAAVAGVLVSEALDRAFTSNRGEDSVGIFRPGAEDVLEKVSVGVLPNGLAIDPGRGTLLAANVGDPTRPSSHTISVVDVAKPALRASIPVPGRTRWAIFDPRLDRFFVNIAAPAQIVSIAAGDPVRILATYEMPAGAPH